MRHQKHVWIGVTVVTSATHPTRDFDHSSASSVRREGKGAVKQGRCLLLLLLL